MGSICLMWETGPLSVLTEPMCVQLQAQLQLKNVHIGGVNGINDPTYHHVFTDCMKASSECESKFTVLDHINHRKNSASDSINK